MRPSWWGGSCTPGRAHPPAVQFQLLLTFRLWWGLTHAFIHPSVHTLFQGCLLTYTFPCDPLWGVKILVAGCGVTVVKRWMDAGPTVLCSRGETDNGLKQSSYRVAGGTLEGGTFMRG